MRLLFISEKDDDVMSVVRELRHFEFEPEYLRVEYAGALSDALDAGSWSAVICDDRVPNLDADAAQHIVRTHDADLPFIILSDLGDEEGAVGSVRSGANDVVARERPGQLARALEREIRDVQLRRELRGLFHALRRAESRYRRVFEKAPVGVAITTPEGQLIAANERFASIHGLPFNDVVGSRVSSLGWDALLQRGRSALTTSELELKRPDGEVVWTRVTAAPLNDDEGNLEQLVWLIEDMTAQKSQVEERQRLTRLEARLEQADRLSSLGRLAATIAHEFNNVLMGISPFIEILRRGGNTEAALDHISRAVKRGKGITEDILRFTQPAQPTRSTFAVAPWLDQIMAEARSIVPLNCGLEWSVDPNDLLIHGDADQLQQILINLALNARDAMPGGGALSVEVRTDAAEIQRRFEAIENPERFAHLVVRDTGHGMNQETLRHIFEPLYTTKPNGTGLGLAVTHQVVQRHDGQIFVESSVGAGTTFHILLPLAGAEEPAHTMPTPDRSAETTTHRKILLIEDDESVASGLVTLLEMEGMDVTVATRGHEAVRAVEAVQPDLVVLDVGLPDMPGTAVYVQIASVRPDLPVIFSTGHTDRSSLDTFLERPDVGYLLKPYDGMTLLAAIREVMNKTS